MKIEMTSEEFWVCGFVMIMITIMITVTSCQKTVDVEKARAGQKTTSP